MAYAGEVIEDPITNQRLTFLKTARDTDGELLMFEDHIGPYGFVNGGIPHVHPIQTERIEVTSGTLRFKVRGRQQDLQAGESVSIPPGVSHAWWNERGEDAQILVELRPALDTESAFETGFGLCRDGKTNDKGFPSFWQMVVLMDAFLDEVCMPWIPLRVQKAVASVLAPLGRRRGYRARYPEYSNQE